MWTSWKTAFEGDPKHLKSFKERNESEKPLIGALQGGDQVVFGGSSNQTVIIGALGDFKVEETSPLAAPFAASRQYLFHMWFFVFYQ